jgi:DNA polymerase III epsilon subunit family exonuclease
MKTHNLAFIDVETTGLNSDLHEIIELGVVLVRQIPEEGKGPALEVVGEYEYKIIPEQLFNADPESLKINGYAPEKWADAKPLKEVMEDFVKRTQGASFVAHNIVMDVAFMNRAFERSGVKNLMHYHKIDTISLAFAKLYHNPKVEKFSLRFLCEYFGIKNENAHTALSDARATFELYKRLTEQ